MIDTYSLTTHRTRNILFIIGVLLSVASGTLLGFEPLDLSRDSDGWTEFVPSIDSRIVYVSENGNDSMAEVYTTSDIEIGRDPTRPVGPVRAFRTYDAARSQARNGRPDWILFRRGDQFSAQIKPLSGFSRREVSLIGAYGESGAMPVITPVDAGSEVLFFSSHRDRKLEYAAISSLDFYAMSRDPGVAQFSGAAGTNGINFIAVGNSTSAGLIHSILIEGCRFRFFASNVMQAIDDGQMSDIGIRRTLFLDNYSNGNGHSQGLYVHRINGFLLEESIFDHNGWYDDASGTLGPATMFNHNTYFADNHDVTFRCNIFLRPSSIGNKFTANLGPASSTDIIIEKNLYVEGEIGIGIGGNTSEPFRFRDIRIEDNVLTEIGRGRPTRRGLGWVLALNDWDTGYVGGNIIAHNSNPQVDYSLGIYVEGSMKNVAITDNTVYGIGGRSFYALDVESQLREDVVVSGNRFQDFDRTAYVIDLPAPNGFLFTDNEYHSPVHNDFLHMRDAISFGRWRDIRGDDSVYNQTAFPDPERSIEGYAESLGLGASFESFITGVRSQGRYSWDEQYAAERVIDWFKEGFDADRPIENVERVTGMGVY